MPVSHNPPKHEFGVTYKQNNSPKTCTKFFEVEKTGKRMIVNNLNKQLYMLCDNMCIILEVRREF